MTKLSIILPYYNGHNFIDEALEGLFSQDFQDFKILIFDDGSVPAFESDRLGRAGFDETRWQLIRSETNKGAGHAREILLKAVKTDYFAFHDADDVSQISRFSRQIAYLDSHSDIDGVGCGIAYIDHQGRVLRRETYPEQSYINGSLHGCCASYLMRSAVLKRQNPQRSVHPNCAEDLAFFDVLKESCELRNMTDILYFYRQHQDQNTQSPTYPYYFLASLLARRGYLDVDQCEMICQMHDLNQIRPLLYSKLQAAGSHLDNIDVGRLAAATLITDVIKKRISFIKAIQLMAGLPRSTLRALRTWIQDAVGRRFLYLKRSGLNSNSN